MTKEDFATLCRQCGAQLVRSDAPCWLCGAEPAFGSPDAQTINPYAPPAVEDIVPRATLLLPPLTVILLVFVVVGLFAVAPGGGVFGTLLVIPVLIRTWMVVRRRHEAGKPVTGWQKVGLFLTSFFVAYVIMLVVTFATFGAFCAACLAGSAATPDRNMLIAFIAAGVVGLLVALGMGYWVRARYRRDISRS